MNLEIRHLRILRAVAELGSVNRAAIALGLSQPNLSRQVRRLEQTLGGTLFERDIRGTRPTELGTAVLGRAEPIMRLLDELEQQLTTLHTQRDRLLRVGWATTPLYELLLRCLDCLDAGNRRPRVVTAASSWELTELVRAGEIDIALIDHESDTPPVCRPGLAEVVLGWSRVALALGAGHPLADGGRIVMADLADEDWITCSGPDGCPDKLRALCEGFGFAPRLAHDIPVNGCRGSVIRNQRCVTLAQVLRPVGPGVVLRPVADLSRGVRHCLLFRTDGPGAAFLPALTRSLSCALRALAHHRAPASGAPGRRAVRPP
ncbi:LysR family transcriptional regulator [Streptomyces sp. LP05-1]|uniref:LysR family transcriptional regulator n=1 Tax=Streptomyces pyxinae TaxID=2970734 RepID=A0ABT2CEA9_9ACTN|nr:LysR family transcriptional regulator [Streptomyces sp. LP05-1]MCS0635447.1 LysR family transcriptional regulator [Streptomyces sp. LP05-1]